jgi:hypothetical protein
MKKWVGFILTVHTVRAEVEDLKAEGTDTAGIPALVLQLLSNAVSHHKDMVAAVKFFDKLITMQLFQLECDGLDTNYGVLCMK